METGVSPSRGVVVGIDNGLTGGVVAVQGGEIMLQNRLPVRDGNLTPQVLLYDLGKFGSEPLTIVIEEPGKFAAGVFALCSTWKIFGQITGSLTAAGYSYQTVAPRSWQAKMLGKVPKGQTKAYALNAYVANFGRQPPTKTDKSKRYHDGIIDAALIALYAEKYLSRCEKTFSFAADSRDQTLRALQGEHSR